MLLLNVMATQCTGRALQALPAGSTNFTAMWIFHSLFIHVFTAASRATDTKSFKIQNLKFLQLLVVSSCFYLTYLLRSMFHSVQQFLSSSLLSKNIKYECSKL
jgi:hypothetical protein